MAHAPMRPPRKEQIMRAAFVAMHARFENECGPRPCNEWADEGQFVRDMGESFPNDIPRTLATVHLSCGGPIASKETCTWADGRAPNLSPKLNASQKQKLAERWSSCKQRAESGEGNYGKYGVRLDPRWRSAAAFTADMGASFPKDFDRVDNDRLDGQFDYSPDNCAWVTKAQNQQNKLDRLPTWVTVDGYDMDTRQAVKMWGAMGLTDAMFCRRLMRNPGAQAQNLLLKPVTDEEKKEDGASGRSEIDSDRAARAHRSVASGYKLLKLAETADDYAAAFSTIHRAADVLAGFGLAPMVPAWVEEQSAASVALRKAQELARAEVAAEKARQDAAQKQQEARQRAAEAERIRLASITPEQRQAEQSRKVEAARLEAERVAAQMAEVAAERAAKDELLRLQHARMMEIREAERVAVQMAQAAAERTRKRRSLFWSCLPLAVVVGGCFYAAQGVQDLQASRVGAAPTGEHCNYIGKGNRAFPGIRWTNGECRQAYESRGVPTRLQEPAAPVPTAQQNTSDDLDNRWSLPMADYVALMEANRSVLQQMRREADTVTASEYLVQTSRADAANLARETEKAAKAAKAAQDEQKQAQRMADHAAQVERQQVAEDAAAVAQWEQRKQVDAAALEATAVAAAAEAKAAQRGLSEKVRLSGGADPAGAIAEVDAAATRAWYARKAADAAEAKAAQRGLSEKVRSSGGADPASAIAEGDAAATRAWYARKAADAAKN